MARRFQDSFDHYATADITTKWTSVNLTSNNSIAAVGRNSGNGWWHNNSGAARYLAKTIDAQATWIIGFAFKTDNLVNHANCQIVGLLDAGSLQVDLRLLTDGTLRVTRNGTTLGTTVFSLSSGTFYFIELKVLIDPTVGTVEVKVNGDSKLSLTGQNTRATANSSANQIFIGNTTGSMGGNAYWDDLYVNDSSTANNNDFSGDIRNECLFPTGAGNYTTFSRGGADSGANWSQVEETAPNGDTDYNESGSLTAKDSFAFGNLVTTTGTIQAVTVRAYVEKTDAGDRRIRFFARIGGTDYFSSVISLGTSYTYQSYTWELSPATGVAWTVSEVNGAEFGYEMNA